MKTFSTSVQQKLKANFVSIFIASLGISYALVSQIFYNKSNLELIVVMICLFSVRLFSSVRKNNSK
jgi:hypothetical protein